MTLEEQRADYYAKAMVKLRYEIIPALDVVIAGTPTGPVRDALTHTQVLLNVIYTRRNDPNNVTVTDIINALP